MKPLLFTVASREFKPMVEEHLWPSLNETHMVDDYDCRCLPGPCRESTFGTEAARVEDRIGILLLRDLIAAHIGRRLILTDADTRFYRRLDLSSLDPAVIYCAQDRIEPRVYCTGLQIFTATPAIVELYELWHKASESEMYAHVQEAFNEVIKTVPNAALDQRFWTIGLGKLERFPWVAGDPVPPAPTDLIWHHANYTIGFQNKMELLGRVRSGWLQQRNKP